MHSKVVIIGSGPAAHTAAIYLARAEMKPVLYEGFVANGIAAGGQLTTTTDVENFPGFPDGIMGPKLMDNMREQSEKAGTTIITETISKLDVSSKPFKYETEWSPGVEHTADAIILATGASARRMGLPGEDTYWQRGISACAVCDGAAPLFRNKKLVVIGGGDSAAEEAMYLTKYASKVFVLVRRDKLRASSVMAQRLSKHPKVKILYTTNALQIKGGSDGNMGSIEIEVGPATKLDEELAAELEKNKTGEGKGFIEAQGLFYAIGHEPATTLVKGQLKTDSEGYIVTQPGTPLTSVEGVFAAGDVQDKRYRQAITSAGSGCMAALDAEKYLVEHEVDDREGPAQGKI